MNVNQVPLLSDVEYRLGVLADVGQSVGALPTAAEHVGIDRTGADRLGRENQSPSSNRMRSSRVAHVQLTGLPRRSKHAGVSPDRQKTFPSTGCDGSAYRPRAPAQPTRSTIQSMLTKPSLVLDIALSPRAASEGDA